MNISKVLNPPPTDHSSAAPIVSAVPEQPPKPPIANEKDVFASVMAEGGGMQVTGDSGTGKSVFLLWLIVIIARMTMFPIMLIDPKGDLAKAVLRFLMRYPSIARRIDYIKPGDPNVPVRVINPLAVHGPADMPEYLRGARLSAKVSHAAHLVLASAGDDDFDQKPRLQKWTTLLLKVAANLGMAMADVLHFINPRSDIFDALTSAIKDDFARAELQELGSLKMDQRERLIESTKNRFTNMFDNPIMETHFGSINARSAHDDYQEGRITLIDLERCGNLREEDVNFLSNVYLMESLDCVFNTPEEQRVPFFLIADELPRLKPSFQLIASSLRVIRGLKTRFIGAHQGVYSFPDGPEDELLQTMQGQCQSHVIFRHHSEPEAMHNARNLALPDYNPLKVKFQHWDKEQYQAGTNIWTLLNTSYTETTGGADAESHESGQSQGGNWSQGNGVGVTATDTDSETASAGLTNNRSVTHNQGKTNTQSESLNDSEMLNDPEAIRRAYGNAHASASSEVHGESAGQAQTQNNSAGHSASNGHNVNQNASQGRSLSWDRHQSVSKHRNWQRSASVSLSQTVVPELAWRNVLRMLEFYSYDEQILLYASQIASLKTGTCFLYSAGGAIEKVAIPFCDDPFQKTPKFAAKKLQAFFDELKTRPGIYHYQDILDYRERLLRQLVAEFGNPQPDSDPGTDPFSQ